MITDISYDSAQLEGDTIDIVCHHINQTPEDECFRLTIANNQVQSMARIISSDICFGTTDSFLLVPSERLRRFIFQIIEFYSDLTLFLTLSMDLHEAQQSAIPTSADSIEQVK